MVLFFLFLGNIWLCAARAHGQGRSAWGWGLFAFFLAPVAFGATWLVGPKQVVSVAPVRPATPPTSQRSARPAPGITVSVATSDSSVVEVTGPGQALVRAAPEPTLTPDYEPAQLGRLYGEKLALSRQEISWLNKFYFYENAFLSIEAGRVATAQLYLAVLKEVEQGFKQAGSTLAQEVKALHEQAQQARRQAYSWYNGENTFVSAGSGAGADIYLAIFKLCEAAVRELYGHKRKISTQFAPAQLVGLEEAFQARFGQAVAGLLPGLLPALPPPSEAAELALNAQNTTRWKATFEQLAARLPTDAMSFTAGMHELARLNARNPAIENIFFEASKLIARHDREEALRLYLHHDLRSATVNNKPLTKTIQKSLFAQPEHLARFEEIARQLTLDRDLPAALAQVPNVYARPRKKIQLDLGAVQAVRQQHSGTVELLNEYLQDAPEPLPTPSTATTAPAEATELEILRPLAPPVTTAAGATFAPSLALSTAQQALLLLFAERALTLPHAEIEALARQHGTLRNQLIDSVNDVCYALLDDVLIEESGDDYTIYEAYYQQLATPC